MKQLSATRVALPGITLSVVDEGSGPAVVLLHGFPDRADMWADHVRALVAAGYRVIAPDLRGFGDSDRPQEPEQYGMPTLVGDVLALADHLGVERFALAGHDWGAGLGWAVTLASDRVTRYAAFSTGHPGAYTAAGMRQKQLAWYILWFDAPGVAEQVLPADDWAVFRAWAHGGASTEDPLVARQIADLSRPGALTAALNLYRANTSPATYALPAMPAEASPRASCPVLGVWSSGDFALTEEQMVSSGGWVDGGFRYERIDDVGHWLVVEAPERTTELLLDFLAEA